VVQSASATPFDYAVVGVDTNRFNNSFQIGQNNNLLSGTITGGTISGDDIPGALQFDLNIASGNRHGAGTLDFHIFDPSVVVTDSGFDSIAYETANHNPANRGTFTNQLGVTRNLGVDDDCAGGVCDWTGIFQTGFELDEVGTQMVDNILWHIYNVSFRVISLDGSGWHALGEFAFSAPQELIPNPPINPPVNPPGSPPSSPVPEPASLLLLSGGLGTLIKKGVRRHS
jgi:hypothetical protein